MCCCMIQSHRVATATHPVHAGKLSPSAKNCKGCSLLQWEDLPISPSIHPRQTSAGVASTRRRLICAGGPWKIPIRCPLTPGSYLPPDPSKSYIQVHSGDLQPSARNCRGCEYLNWEVLPGYHRRRICQLSGRIPGNIRCPLTESEADQGE